MQNLRPFVAKVRTSKIWFSVLVFFFPIIRAIDLLIEELQCYRGWRSSGNRQSRSFSSSSPRDLPKNGTRSTNFIRESLYSLSRIMFLFVISSFDCRVVTEDWSSIESWPLYVVRDIYIPISISYFFRRINQIFSVFKVGFVMFETVATVVVFQDTDLAWGKNKIS